MEEFLHNINLRQDQILLMAPPILQLGEWVPSKHLVDESRILNERYRVIAKELKLGFADTAEWNIPIAFDGVHFTQEGHRAFAYQLAKHIP
jgi:lysophospholipase L1-like esterase